MRHLKRHDVPLGAVTGSGYLLPTLGPTRAISAALTSPGLLSIWFEYDDYMAVTPTTMKVQVLRDTYEIVPTNAMHIQTLVNGAEVLHVYVDHGGASEPRADV